MAFFPYFTKELVVKQFSVSSNLLVFESLICEIVNLFTSCSCRSYYNVSTKSPDGNQRFQGAFAVKE